MTLGNITEKVLERLYPDEQEVLDNEKMFAEIREFVAEEFDRESRLMGSIAKDTFISGDNDLDIFVFFAPDASEDFLEEKGLQIGEAVFEEFDGEYDIEYAEHPYTNGVIDGYEVEIVPAYDVDAGNAIQSSVDRTPFHTDWVNEHLSEQEKQEVVVLKAFLRGQGLYGSTLRVEGFSGYLCELLIAEYGSFEAVMEAAMDWDEDEVIDPADHHDILPNYLREMFSDEALVVIDPVDPERNVAAVLSTANYSRFIHRAWQFMQDPDLSFFFPEDDQVQKLDVEKALVDRGDFVMVQFPRPDMLDDILYPQLRRLLSRLEQVLADNEFRLFESGFHVDDNAVRILFELYSADLPTCRQHVGPKVFHNTEHMANFTEKYDDVWVEDTRLVTIVERDHRNADALLREFLSGDLQENGVPKNLVDVVQDREVGDIVLEDDDAWLGFLTESFRL
jgi:tRNA nucleotidyltransferase (CCA-adding enzyme)